MRMSLMKKLKRLNEQKQLQAGQCLQQLCLQLLQEDEVHYSLKFKISVRDAENAKAEQVLEVEIWIDNNSDSELIVNDMIRGLVWYVQPHESIQFEVKNPEMANLRVSDLNNSNVEYVTVGVGSSIRKEFISYEDDDCWVADIYQKDLSVNEHRVPIAYNYINKTTYETKRLSIREYNEFKKEVKSREKQEKEK